MTVKERIIKRLEEMDEEHLLELERGLNAVKSKTPLEHKLRLLNRVKGILADPEDLAAYEQEARRRPLFGPDRKLDLEP